MTNNHTSPETEMPACILVVDDETAIGYSIGKALQRIGAQVTSAASGQEALKLLGEQAFEVVLTDVRMPGLSGLELLARIKERWPETVVIMMTDYASLDTVIDSMRLGASDYLIKSSDHQDIRRSVLRGLERALEQKRRRILLETIQASIRELTTERISPTRTGPGPLDSGANGAAALLTASYQTIKVGPLTIYPGKYQISVDNHLIPITSTEFDLMMHLVANRGRVVPCQELIREVRGYTASETEARKVIRPHISNLRRKLISVGLEDGLIINVRGVGYRLSDKLKEQDIQLEFQRES